MAEIMESQPETSTAPLTPEELNGMIEMLKNEEYFQVITPSEIFKINSMNTEVEGWGPDLSPGFVGTIQMLCVPEMLNMQNKMAAAFSGDPNAKNPDDVDITYMELSRKAVQGMATLEILRVLATADEMPEESDAKQLFNIMMPTVRNKFGAAFAWNTNIYFPFASVVNKVAIKLANDGIQKKFKDPLSDLEQGHEIPESSVDASTQTEPTNADGTEIVVPAITVTEKAPPVPVPETIPTVSLESAPTTASQDASTDASGTVLGLPGLIGTVVAAQQPATSSEAAPAPESETKQPKTDMEIMMEGVPKEIMPVIEQAGYRATLADAAYAALIKVADSPLLASSGFKDMWEGYVKMYASQYLAAEDYLKVEYVEFKKKLPKLN